MGRPSRPRLGRRGQAKRGWSPAGPAGTPDTGNPGKGFGCLGRPGSPGGGAPGGESPPPEAPVRLPPPMAPAGPPPTPVVPPTAPEPLCWKVGPGPGPRPSPIPVPNVVVIGGLPIVPGPCTGRPMAEPPAFPVGVPGLEDPDGGGPAGPDPGGPPGGCPTGNIVLSENFSGRRAPGTSREWGKGGQRPRASRSAQGLALRIENKYAKLPANVPTDGGLLRYLLADAPLPSPPLQSKPTPVLSPLPAAAGGEGR